MWRHSVFIPVYALCALLPFLLAVGHNLEYEYATLFSWSILAALPIYVLFIPKKWLPLTKFSKNAPTIAKFRAPKPLDWFWVFIAAPSLCLIPGLWTFASGGCQCSKPGFMFWMVVQGYPAWIMAHGFAYGAARLRLRSFSSVRIGLSYILYVVVALLLLGLEVWTTPQKRVSHLLTGFLHGPIYDEWINVDNGVILARFGHFCAATLLVNLAWIRNRTMSLSAVVIWAGAWVVATGTSLWFPSNTMGIGALQRQIPSEIHGNGFTLHYVLPPQGNAAVPVNIQRLARDSNFHITELRKIFASNDPRFRLPDVHIFVYPDEDAKKLWFGGAATDITDVYTPSIHITGNEWPHPTLRHELVHALASGFGYRGLGFHPNLVFTEGLATALAPTEQTLSLDEGAAHNIESGRVPNLDDLFSPMAFLNSSGARSYTVAGSFVNFLIENYTMNSVMLLYSGVPWNDAIKEPQGAVLGKWRDKVLKSYDKERVNLQAEALFRYPGVLGDLCPHSKADLRRPRNESVYVRTRQPINWDPETDYSQWLLSLDPNNISTRLDIWRQEIRKIAEDHFPKTDKIAAWRDTISRARNWPPKNIEDIDLAILESDLARLGGDTPGSVRVLEDLMSLMTQKPINDNLSRQIGARIGIEKLTRDPIALEWRKYLAGWRKPLPELVEGEPWLLSYLRLRRAPIPQASTGNPNTAPSPSSSNLGLMADLAADPAMVSLLGPTYKAFTLEWFRLIANRLMIAESYKEAAQAFQLAADAADPGKKPILIEHQRRAEFYNSLGNL